MTRRVYALSLALTALMLTSCSSEKELPGGSGLIEANEVTVSAETTGRLEQFYFDEGEIIEAGDIIALIDTSTISLRLDQAKAVMRAIQSQKENARIKIELTALDDSLAQKEFERVSKLIESGSANRQQYDKIENAAGKARLARKAAEVALETADAELAKIRAEIGLLEKQLADCRPLSPASGTVLTTYVEQGELIAAGKPMIKVARLDTVWVKIYLPPADLTEIKLGNKADVDPEDGREQPMTGTISWISSEAEFTPKNVQTKQARADLIYAVKIVVPNDNHTLKIGMPVSVTIP